MGIWKLLWSKKQFELRVSEAYGDGPTVMNKRISHSKMLEFISRANFSPRTAARLTAGCQKKWGSGFLILAFHFSFVLIFNLKGLTPLTSQDFDYSLLPLGRQIRIIFILIIQWCSPFLKGENQFSTHDCVIQYVYL